MQVKNHILDCLEKELPIIKTNRDRPKLAVPVKSVCKKKAEQSIGKTFELEFLRFQRLKSSKLKQDLLLPVKIVKGLVKVEKKHENKLKKPCVGQL